MILQDWIGLDRPVKLRVGIPGGESPPGKKNYKELGSWMKFVDWDLLNPFCDVLKVLKNIVDNVVYIVVVLLLCS